MTLLLPRLLAILGAIVLVALAIAASPQGWFAPALAAGLLLALGFGYFAGRLRGGRQLPRIAEEIERLSAGAAPQDWPRRLSRSEQDVFEACRRTAEELARRGREDALAADQSFFDGRQDALERLASGLAGRFGQALGGARAALAAAEQAAGRRDSSQDERLAAEMANARRALERAAALVNGLRALAPATTPTPSAVPLDDMVRRAVDERRARAGRINVVLEFASAQAPLLVSADAAALSAAVGPLIDNALDALEGRGGRVDVRIEAEADGRGPRVVVEDDGPGLSPAALERAFDPFFTTRPASDGLGLGLVFARAAAAQCGGALTLAPRPAGGVRAVFDLPWPHHGRNPARAPAARSDAG